MEPMQIKSATDSRRVPCKGAREWCRGWRGLGAAFLAVFVVAEVLTHHPTTKGPVNAALHSASETVRGWMPAGGASSDGVSSALRGGADDAGADWGDGSDDGDGWGEGRATPGPTMNPTHSGWAGELEDQAAAELLVPLPSRGEFSFYIMDSLPAHLHKNRAGCDVGASGGKSERCMEMTVHAVLEQSPWRTMDPQNATAFYLPFHARIVALNHNHCGHCDEAARFLGERLAAFGVDPREACTFLTVGTNFNWEVLGPLWGKVATMGYEVYAFNRRACTPVDISIPYYAVPEIAVDMVTGANNDSQALAHAAETAYWFQGNSHRHGAPVRQNINQIFAVHRDAIHNGTGLTSHVVDSRNKATHLNYITGMERSKYCFAPRGDTQTCGHLFNAILAGCIPVIVATRPRWVLPFEGIVPWDEFSVRLHEDDVLRKENWPRTAALLNKLLRPEVYARYHAALLKHRKYFVSTVHAQFASNDVPTGITTTSEAFGAALVIEMAARVSKGLCQPNRGKHSNDMDRPSRCSECGPKDCGTNPPNTLWDYTPVYWGAFQDDSPWYKK